MLKFFRRAPQKPVINSLSNINALVMEGNDYLSDRVIFLDQKLTGNLFCSENIFIEKDGRLDGNICSKHLVVGGIVNGNISATELLEITKTAVIKGKVRATSICIEPGAIVNGAITIGEDKAAITTLAQRIKKHTTEEYAEARALDEAITADTTVAAPVIIQTNTAIKEAKATVVEPPVAKPQVVVEQNIEPKEQPLVKEEPKPIVAPPLSTAEQIINEEPVKKPASTPTPRPSDKPKEDNNIQRWW